MDSLRLTLPSPNPGTQLLVETRPDKFRRWLEDLPSGNMVRFVTEVADAITNINRTEMPIAQRMELVHTVDIAYKSIHNYYRPLTKSGPHKGKHAPFDELSEVYRLTKEMSFAYKRAVYDYMGKKILFGKNKNLANAINMALHYLGLILLEHYELYSPIPMHVWSEVHHLYYYAEQRDLSELSIPQNNLEGCFDNTEMTYIRICLISLSNPYHFKRGDHWEVYEYLSNWTSQAIISEDPDDFSPQNCFVIDLDSDDKPKALKSLDDRNNSLLRFILTRQLIIKLCHHVDSIQYTNKSPVKCFSKNVVARKATELLKDMLTSWEMKQERKAERYPKISKMETIWGLNNIHKVLSSIDPLIPNDNSVDKEKISGLIEQHWNTVNTSKGGICIAQLKEVTQDIDVGLLVAIRQSISGEEPENWTLGSICWITGNKRNGTQIGIKYINGEIQAIRLQARKGNKIETRFQPALMISGDIIDGLTTPTLITKMGLYVESRPMVLQVGEVEQFIHARMKVSSMGTVDRFFYQPDSQESSANLKPYEDKKSDNTESENEEVIDLTGVAPTPRKGELQEEEERQQKIREESVVTLDDIIVSKNK